MMCLVETLILIVIIFQYHGSKEEGRKEGSQEGRKEGRS